MQHAFWSFKEQKTSALANWWFSLEIGVC